MALNKVFVLTFIVLWVISSFDMITMSTITNTTDKPHSFTFDLIHHDSSSSPFFNPNMSQYDRIELGIKRSVSRHAYLSSKQKTNISTNAIEGQVCADSNGAEFLVRMSIGTPPVEIYVIVDTGSSLLWTQCKPCNECYKQHIPIYDRTKSTTYASLSCGSYCKAIKFSDCFRNICTYHQNYLDGSYTEGYISTEVLSSMSKTGLRFQIPNVVFGCGIANYHHVHGEATGILGLGPDHFSLVSQLDQSSLRFSYCIANLSDSRNLGNLVIGNGAIMSGSITQMQVVDGKYYLFVKDISIGSRKLGIDPKIFELKRNGHGGMIIDSGTHYSFLPHAAYNTTMTALSNELKRFKLRIVPDGDGKSQRLCALGSIARDVKRVFTMSFNFKDGTNLVLDKWSAFTQENDKLCAAFLPANDEEFGIIGNMAQQFYNIGYDLKRNVVYLKPSKCE